jgi:hypothetical protein
LQSTNRSANHEFSPLHNPYGGCDFQGVEAGWVDQYKIGLPCQWVDITDVDARRARTANLTFSSNPDGFLCEGEPVLDDNGDPIYDPTEFVNHDGEQVFRQRCDYEEGALDNNVDSYPVTVPRSGETYVSLPCDRGQVGPLRNCGYALSQDALTCTPGERVRLSCTVASRGAPQVARVCERSAVLNTAMACTERMALTSQAIDRSAILELTCPAARTGEPGGRYSIFAGAAFPDDARAAVTCTKL